MNVLWSFDILRRTRTTQKEKVWTEQTQTNLNVITARFKTRPIKPRLRTHTDVKVSVCSLCDIYNHVISILLYSLAISCILTINANINANFKNAFVTWSGEILEQLQELKHTVPFPSFYCTCRADRG